MWSKSYRKLSVFCFLTISLFSYSSGLKKIKIKKVLSSQLITRPLPPPPQLNSIESLNGQSLSKSKNEMNSFNVGHYTSIRGDNSKRDKIERREDENISQEEEEAENQIGNYYYYFSSTTQPSIPDSLSQDLYLYDPEVTNYQLSNNKQYYYYNPHNPHRRVPLKYYNPDRQTPIFAAPVPTPGVLATILSVLGLFGGIGLFPFMLIFGLPLLIVTPLLLLLFTPIPTLNLTIPANATGLTGLAGLTSIQFPRLAKDILRDDQCIQRISCEINRISSKGSSGGKDENSISNGFLEMVEIAENFLKNLNEDFNEKSRENESTRRESECSKYKCGNSILEKLKLN